ncbi:neural/ectodermal development factor IMP-L2-like isoform X2 [Plodia interpunctella]|uniref:neural/ectodermal development factor IMP-L2-like isoform X2 n=1 Tax=Plodia interpunctella TaxID=58824 RepID=UPI0023680935|nr:neural/ectodermal development factor IMP-L2-like isoform X2 [Plodia interpunctella]
MLQSLLLVAVLSVSRGSNVNRNTAIFVDNRIRHNAIAPSEPLKVFALFVRPRPFVAHAPGTSVELTCEAYGSPAPSIHWYKNDAPVYEHDLESNEHIDTNPESLARVVSTLLVTKTETEDLYRCVVKSGGRMKSATSKVYRSNGDGGTEMPERSRLNPLAPRILVTYKAYVDQIGNRVVLPCRVRGHPRPHITWTHRGMMDTKEVIVKNGPRMKVLRSGELVLSPLRWTDIGNFTCRASNVFGEQLATTFVYPAKPE